MVHARASCTLLYCDQGGRQGGGPDGGGARESSIKGVWVGLEKNGGVLVRVVSGRSAGSDAMAAR